MMKKVVFLFVVLNGLFFKMYAQHDQHDHHAMKHDTVDAPSMSHAFSLNLPMNRNGSGTGWLPDASPMYGSMSHKKDWMFMMHGSLFLRYNNQDFTNKGVRGDSDFDAPNWFMLMGQRKVRQKGLFHFNVMLSLDPITQGKRGYPLLYQSGETYKGQPLVDRQHPHDFISELSVSYSHAFSKKTDAFVYVGYPGEPALGPVTFMHRPSALDNPNSPISHHWVDATHITFGVVTGGLRVGKTKFEGSVFTGREPNENRYSFDRPKFDSWSGRFSYNPGKNLALQVSHGFVKSPEAAHANDNVHKTTASAVYSLNFGGEDLINATALWGMNKKKDHDGENAILLEGAWRKKRNVLYARYEWTQKSAEELVLDDRFDEHEVFPVHAFTVGDNFDVFDFGKIRVAAGAQFSLFSASYLLDKVYGKNPVSFQVYLRVYPSVMRM